MPNVADMTIVEIYSKLPSFTSSSTSYPNCRVIELLVKKRWFECTALLCCQLNEGHLQVGKNLSNCYSITQNSQSLFNSGMRMSFDVSATVKIKLILLKV